MSVFGVYARYYDLIYRDKDYRQEADFVRALLERLAPGCRTILELGCGTGGHAEHLARAGLEIHGVDISADMLQLASARYARLSPELRSRLLLSQGDVRSVDLGRTYDAVISLFHVMSYQTTNQDLLDAFATARRHLKPGGLLVFDCWYGPAVLSDPPAVRVKRWEDNGIRVLRIAEPVMFPNDNTVDVNYQILVDEISGNQTVQINETHRMRYLFRPEIELMLASAGLGLEECREFGTGRSPGFGSWSVCFVARVPEGHDHPRK